MKPGLNQNDGIHPNREGTVVMSATLEKSIIRFIKKKY
jgi:acyl-CoA thioesterase-1